jgi:Mn2+/Fe2+ NRAMP family transporter
MWVIVIAAIGMATYTTMAARYGVTHDKSLLSTVAESYGRWFAVLIGISCFLVAASFQFGNNLGVATAMQSITGITEFIWPIVFTTLAIILVFFAQNLYKILEKLMMILVMVMITAFFINLFFAKPILTDAASGFVPVLPENGFDDMAALVATTFCLHVALYQSYLVQNKGWRLKEYRTSMKDVYSGIAMLGGISALIIMTSAAVLNPNQIQIASAADMAIQLETLFGESAKFIFSLGLFAAAFSSLTVNAIAGGNLISDGLGLGRSMEEKFPKIFAALIMVVGMLIAVFFRGNIIYALVLAQAATLLAVPSVAIGLFMVANNKKIMESYKNTGIQNGLALFGGILVMIMVYFMYQRLLTTIGAAF